MIRQLEDVLHRRKRNDSTDDKIRAQGIVDEISVKKKRNNETKACPPTH